MLFLNENEKNGGYELSYHQNGSLESWEDFDDFMLRFPESKIAMTTCTEPVSAALPDEVKERIAWCKHLANARNVQSLLMKEKILQILKDNGLEQDVLEELPPYVTKAKFTDTAFIFTVPIDGEVVEFTVEDEVMGWYIEPDMEPVEYYRNPISGLFNIYEDKSAAREKEEEV